MATMTFDPKLQPVADRALLALPGVRKGQAFGLPGYFLGKKLLACLYVDGLTLKLPLAMAQDLLQQCRVAPFEPMPGRPMCEWVLIRPATAALLRARRAWLEAAVEYVKSLDTAAAPKQPAGKQRAGKKRAARPSAAKRPSARRPR